MTLGNDEGMPVATGDGTAPGARVEEEVAMMV